MLLEKPVAEQANALWGALEELIQENLCQNPMHPTQDEIGNIISTLVLLAAEIHRTVLTQTHGQTREAIYTAWTTGLGAANQARQIFEAQEVPQDAGESQGTQTLGT